MSSGLDIQQFVGRVDVLRASLWPLLWIFPVISDLVHWVSPLRSSVTVVCLCAACFFAEHWIPVAFLTLSLTLLLGFVKSKAYGASLNRAQGRGLLYKPRYRDNTTHFLESCHEDGVKTDESIRKFRYLIVQLQEGVLQAFHATEEVRNVLYWREPLRSVKYLIGSILISIIYWLFSWRLVLVITIVWSFTVNGCLFEKIRDRMMRFKKGHLSPPTITVTNTANESLHTISNGRLTVKHAEGSQSSNDDEDDDDDEIDVQSMNQLKFEESTDSNEVGLTRSQAMQESLDINATIDAEAAKSSPLTRFLRRRRTNMNPPVKSQRTKPIKPRCFSCNKLLGSSHVCCSNCGDKFCEHCCSNHIPRSRLGATSPAAYHETVLVCGGCYLRLLKK